MVTVSTMTPPNDVNLTGPMALPDDKHVWLTDAADAIKRLAHTGRQFTADDVRKIIGSPEHPNWWGIAFAAAKRQKVIQPVAFGTARAKSRNGGSLKVWTARERSTS